MTIEITHPVPIGNKSRLKNIKHFIRELFTVDIIRLKTRERNDISFIHTPGAATIAVTVSIYRGTHMSRDMVDIVGRKLLRYMDSCMRSHYGVHSKNIEVYFVFI